MLLYCRTTMAQLVGRPWSPGLVAHLLISSVPGQDTKPQTLGALIAVLFLLLLLLFISAYLELSSVICKDCWVSKLLCVSVFCCFMCQRKWSLHINRYLIDVLMSGLDSSFSHSLKVKRLLGCKLKVYRHILWFNDFMSLFAVSFTFKIQCYRERKVNISLSVWLIFIYNETVIIV